MHRRTLRRCRFGHRRTVRRCCIIRRRPCHRRTFRRRRTFHRRTFRRCRIMHRRTFRRRIFHRRRPIYRRTFRRRTFNRRTVRRPPSPKPSPVLTVFRILREPILTEGVGSGDNSPPMPDREGETENNSQAGHYKHIINFMSELHSKCNTNPYTDKYVNNSAYLPI